MNDKNFDNILALDTSSLDLKLALSFGGDRLVKSRETMDKTHGRVIIKKINELFSSAGLRPDALEALVVSVGPGSFTGLRISLAVAKGMAVALDIPVVAVSMFELAAFKIRQEKTPVKVLVPFKKNEFFLVSVTGGEFDSATIMTVSLADFHEKVGDSPVVGVNVDIAAIFPDARLLPGRGKIEYDAADLIFLGQEKLAKGAITDLAALEPLYLQKSQAEIRFEKLRKDQKA
ncbi:MAG: tRNA (adenosine(37)-N6)-threonylcarbamoyltransferase complex dimerization subunit type 1 TsaB [Candidatus Zixiibacteriota bacterium]